MKEQDYIDEIARLKREISELKKLKDAHESRRAAVPYALIVKYGSEKNRPGYEFDFLCHEELSSLCLIVRKTIFEKEKRTTVNGKKALRSEYGRTTQSLNDEEYQKYTDCLDELLQVLQKRSVLWNPDTPA